MWDGVIAELGDEFPVAAPHVRGFGGRPAGHGPASLEVMADELLECIREQKWGSIVLAGMSMGGYVALAFAERHPDFLAGIALVNSQAKADTDAGRESRRAMIARVREAGPEAAAEAILPRLLSPNKFAEADLRRKTLKGARLAGVDGITFALEAMATRPDRTHVLRQLRCPVLILHSSDDLIVPAGSARELAESLEGSEYVEIVGAGHAAAIEVPGKVAEALSNFHANCLTW